jgi:hypothetical protein
VVERFQDGLVFDGGGQDMLAAEGFSVFAEAKNHQVGALGCTASEQDFIAASPRKRGGQEGNPCFFLMPKFWMAFLNYESSVL